MQNILFVFLGIPQVFTHQTLKTQHEEKKRNKKWGIGEHQQPQKNIVNALLAPVC